MPEKVLLRTETTQAADAVWEYVVSIKSVRKRDGRIEPFQQGKITASVCAAFQEANIRDTALQHRIVEHLLSRLQHRYDGVLIPNTEEIRGFVAVTLIDENLPQVAKQYLESRICARKAGEEPVYGHGLQIDRFLTREGVHPYDELEWEMRDAVITNEKGKIVFEQKNVEVPKSYSQTATNIIVSKYFRGRIGLPDRESSVRQLVDRVAKTITQWGRRDGYFETKKDAQIFEDELTSILVNQRAAFNSPVWFNVGIAPWPQCSACFINSVQDDMRSIMNLAVTEGMLFKYGSGTGTNLSPLRSSKEHLSQSSGKSSGPVSFMRGFDAFAGVIKSGGKTRRAAKMVMLNIDHPDVAEFIWCKAKEEKKAHMLIAAGYDGSLNGEAYSSIFFQNANNSVRLTDDFLRAVENDADWWTQTITTKEPCERFRARELMRQIAQAAWECGDPGIQYDTTVNRWNTCSNTDRIHASNPCSEYMFLNDTACNLASVNLMRCRKPNGDFDVAIFEHICRIIITAQEIIIGSSSYPTPAIEQNSFDFRSLGIGYANLGSLLMAMGFAYDSDEGRNIAAAVTSVMSGVSYDQSARIAEKMGPFFHYARNREPMQNVIRQHQNHAMKLSSARVPHDLSERARTAWDDALARGERSGFRNAQISVLAPTGTISFLMDCATTGIEPDIALVKYKWLVGGGMLKIVNDTVSEALHRLGYTEMEIRAVLAHIDAKDTIENAPHLKPEHLSIFDCAFKPAKGVRSIHYTGHIRMMAAVQPFISGAISKTVNMAHEATVEEVENVYMEAWKLGLKAVAIYRDGCKLAQPLTTSLDEGSKKKEKEKTALPAATSTGEVYVPRRRVMNEERRSITHGFQIGPHKGYFTVGLYDNGEPGEIFINISKQGSVISGLMDSFAIAISIGLQYGVPLKVLAKKFSHVRFEPSGFTQHPNIRYAKSIVDYIFRWMAWKFLSPEEQQMIGINTEQATIAVFPDAQPNSDALQQASLLASSASVADSQKLTSSFENQSDAPACDTCGSIMVRNAACYKCLNCGATSGCS